MKRSAMFLMLLIVGLLAGCGPAEESPEAITPAGGETVELSLPVAYAGTIPCADCPGIRLTIKLRPDSLYLIRRTYLEAENGQDRSFFTLGGWALADSMLRLYSSDQRPHLFRLSADSLEMLDAEGNPIETELNYTLARVDTAVTLNGPFPMTGLFSYMADAARFELCGSGEDFPVAMEGAYLPLERAYLELRTETNEQVLARIEGHLSVQPGMEVGTKVEKVVVDEFIELAPGASCPPADRSL